MENCGNLLGQFLPAPANPNHDGLRTEDAAEAQFRILVANPVFSTLVFPCIRNCFNVDIHVDGELVHHCANCDIELVLGICNVGFPGFFPSVLVWGCRTVEWKRLARGTSPAGTGYGRVAELRPRKRRSLTWGRAIENTTS